MEYKDTILPNEEELRTLKNGYILAQKNSLDDLSEIYKKMLEERDYLLSQNLSAKHPKLLQNLEQSIDNMGAILEAYNKEKRGQKSSSNSFSAFRPRTASSEDLESDNTLENANQNDDSLEQNGQSEPPKAEENEDTAPPSYEPNRNKNANDFSPDESGQQNNKLTNENTNSSTAQQSKHQNRGRPFRQNSIAKVFSNFPLNFDKIKERQKEKISQQKSSKTNSGTPSTQEKTLKTNRPNPPYPPCDMPNCDRRPPFPPEWNTPKPPFPPSPKPPQSGCDPHKKMVTKELDIIRLLLLYMALRPNCPYTYRLCTIAQDHLEILGEMLEHNQPDDWK